MGATVIDGLSNREGVRRRSAEVRAPGVGTVLPLAPPPHLPVCPWGPLPGTPSSPPPLLLPRPWPPDRRNTHSHTSTDTHAWTQDPDLTDHSVF